MLAANRVLAGDPVIQTVITDELTELRRRLLDSTGLGAGPGELAPAALMSWLVFVRALCVEWLTHQAFSRTELREMCVGALLGALRPVMDLDRLLTGEEEPPADPQATP
ncbi:hypothetical protein [Streptomyces platensis]|uniref:hypothetical protein n=1 Tax=Streptomyces platensis TaxID=58346 RepID=UPI002E275BF2